MSETADAPEATQTTEPVEAPAKVKRVLNESQLAQLSRAREKALEVRRQQHAAKLQAKAAELQASEPTTAEEPALSPPPPPKKAKRPKADPVVVVEQETDDDDEFESAPGVIFVKRKKGRPKAEPPPPPMSEEDAYVDQMYTRMFSGQFQFR